MWVNLWSQGSRPGGAVWLCLCLPWAPCDFQAMFPPSGAPAARPAEPWGLGLHLQPLNPSGSHRGQDTQATGNTG